MHNPWPPRSGAHRRCLWLLDNFVGAGAEVVFASSNVHSEQPWTNAAKNSLEGRGISKMAVYSPGRFDKTIDKWIPKKRNAHGIQKIFDEQPCEFSCKFWFHRLVERERPDLIVINYAWFDQLMLHGKWKGIKTAMETHDFLSVNKVYRDQAYRLLALRSVGASPEEVYNLRIMAEVPFPDIDSEIQIYDRYDKTIAISAVDSVALKSKLKNSEVALIPIGEKPRYLSNQYREGIVLSVGPNPFNQLALGFFCEQVWPLVRKLNPRARAYITGLINAPCPIPEGVEHLGFVENLELLFEQVKFAVSPVFIGTGQQVKIVEYLACGLGVVAVDVSTVSPLLKNGINGLLAKDANEMAHAIAALYDDDARCRSYGMAAREAIALDHMENIFFKRAFL
jgi:glycosyltransferase involved in cell wall biosynthesis